MTLGRGCQFGLVPLPDDRAYWFLCVPADRPGLRYGDARAEILARVAGWHRPVNELVEATATDRILYTDVFDLDPLPTYVGRRIAVLGDAAHAMTPALGQGACQAIEDAVVLAHELAGRPDIGPALGSYDAQRRARTQPMARAARRSYRQTLSTSALSAALARIAIPLIPPGLWRRSMARWTDWTPPVPRPGGG